MIMPNLSLDRGFRGATSVKTIFCLELSKFVIKGAETLGQREVDSLDNHSRQLHLLSNVIKPTAYGKQQRQILCDFLHERNTLPIVEKRFNPISYHLCLETKLI